jgi:hypothetical protein
VAIADGRHQSLDKGFVAETSQHAIAELRRSRTVARRPKLRLLAEASQSPNIFISRFAQHSGGICQAQNSGSDSLIESTVCGNASAKAENKKQGPPL